MPPSRGGTSLPKESGQSGIDSAASLLVTRPPAITSSRVHTATNTEYRCSQTFPIGYRSVQGLGRLPGNLPDVLPLKREILSLAFLGAYRDGLVLRAVLLMPDLDGVGPWRKSLDGKRSVVAGHSKERMVYDADIGPHPRMDVALHRNHDFLPGKSLDLILAAGGLRLVPIVVDRWLRVDIVVGAVAGLDVDVLSGHDPDHARLVHAAILIELDSRGGHLPGLVRQTGLDPDERILQRAIVIDDDGFGLLPVGMRLRAKGDGRHIEGLWCRLSAVEDNLAGDRAAVGFVRRRSGAARGRRGSAAIGRLGAVEDALAGVVAAVGFVRRRGGAPRGRGGSAVMGRFGSFGPAATHH